RIAHSSNERTIITSMAQPKGSRPPLQSELEPVQVEPKNYRSGSRPPAVVTATRCHLTYALNQAGQWLHLGYRKELGKIVGRSDPPSHSGPRSFWSVVSP